MARGKKLQLTDKDLEIYRYCKAEYCKNFEFPKYTTIGKHFGINDSSVAYHLVRLSRAKLLERTGNNPSQGSPFKLPAGEWKNDD